MNSEKLVKIQKKVQIERMKLFIFSILIVCILIALVVKIENSVLPLKPTYKMMLLASLGDLFIVWAIVVLAIISVSINKWCSQLISYIAQVVCHILNITFWITRYWKNNTVLQNVLMVILSLIMTLVWLFFTYYFAGYVYRLDNLIILCDDLCSAVIENKKKIDNYNEIVNKLNTMETKIEEIAEKLDKHYKKRTIEELNYDSKIPDYSAPNIHMFYCNGYIEFFSEIKKYNARNESLNQAIDKQFEKIKLIDELIEGKEKLTNEAYKNVQRIGTISAGCDVPLKKVGESNFEMLRKKTKLEKKIKNSIRRK